MDNNTVYYYFSTCAQSVAAIVAVSATFLLFKLQDLQRTLSKLVEETWEFCSVWLHMTPNVKTEVMRIVSISEKIEFIISNITKHRNEIDTMIDRFRHDPLNRTKYAEEIRNFDNYLGIQSDRLNSIKAEISSFSRDLSRSFLYGLILIVISILGIFMAELPTAALMLKGPLLGIHSFILLAYFRVLWKMFVK